MRFTGTMRCMTVLSSCTLVHARGLHRIEAPLRRGLVVILTPLRRSLN
jgi:hypothetical protein